MKVSFLWILILCFGLQSMAQQQGGYLIRAGKLFDSESGQFLNGMNIIVKGNRVEAVKPEKEVTADEKKNFQLIDLSSMVVMPGLIDAHTHLLNRETIYPGNHAPGLDMAKNLVLDGDAYRAVYGAARAKAYVESGILAVQDLGNSGRFADMALRRAINEGLVTGPRMRCSGPGLATEGGQLPGLVYAHRDLVNDEYRIVLNPGDAVQAVRENVTQGADIIKIYANNTPNNTSLSVEEISAIVREAHRYGIRVTAHATDNRAIYNAVAGGVDGIEHGYQVDDSTLALMAAKAVVLVPTDGDSVEISQYIMLQNPGFSDKEKAEIPKNAQGYLNFTRDRIQRAIRQKVTIVAGSDDYVDFHLPFAEASIRNLIGYVRSGLTIPQTLQAATINAARHLRWEGKIGIIRKGAFADIVAFGGDLDRNINALLHSEFVMMNGKIIKSPPAK